MVPSTSRRNAAALLIAVAVLAILGLLAASFARLSRVERSASAQHSLGVRATLLAEAGVEWAVCQIRARAALGYDPPFPEPEHDPDAPRVFGRPVTLVLDHPSEEAARRPGLPVGSRRVLGRPGGRDWGTASVRIVDAASRIDVNRGDARLARMLETLGWAIDRRDPPIRPGEGLRIVDYRNQLPGGVFRSVDELLDVPGGLVGRRDLARLSPYLTTWAWVDPDTIRPAAPETRPPIGGRFAGRLPPGRLESDPRAPVNINTASRPVLIALLSGLQGAYSEPSREVVLFALGDIESASTALLSDAIDLDKAERLADAIIAWRSMPARQEPGRPSIGGPFRTWADFERFVDLLVERESYSRSAYVTVESIGGSGVTTCHLVEAGPPPWWTDPVAALTNEHDILRQTIVYGEELERPKVLGSFELSTGRFDESLRVTGRLATVVDTGEIRDLYGLYLPAARIEVLVGDPTAIELTRPEGVYRFSASGRFDTKTVCAFVDGDEYQLSIPLLLALAPSSIELEPFWAGRPVVVDPIQAAVLKANFDPNSRLNKFNPDADHRRIVDKSDLRVWSTEFCFGSGGVYEIESTGRVHRDGGEIAAASSIRAVVRTHEVWRHTTQADLSTGLVSEAAGAHRGKALTSYPQPDLDGLPSTCRTDGYVMLSTRRLPPSASRTFHADFEDGFDATAARGSPLMLQDLGAPPYGPWAGDLHDPETAGSLFPDGVYSERGNTPSYFARGNLGGKRGTIAFWFKPSWSPSAMVPWTFHKMIDASKGESIAPAGGEDVVAWNGTQCFQLGAANLLLFPLFGFHYERLREDLENEGGDDVPDQFSERIGFKLLGRGAGEWILVVASYDLESHLAPGPPPAYQRALRLGVDGSTEGYFQIFWYDWVLEDLPTSVSELGEIEYAYSGAEDLAIDELATSGKNRFSLGAKGSGGAYPFGRGADATVDEVACYGGFEASELLEILGRQGRYHDGGDGRLLSAPIDLPADASVASIAWTARVPSSVPGGRVRARVLVGDAVSDVVGDAGGSPIGLPVDGPVHYEILFEDEAAATGVPLLTSPLLDDVTLRIQRPTRFLSWRELDEAIEGRPVDEPAAPIPTDIGRVAEGPPRTRIELPVGLPPRVLPTPQPPIPREVSRVANRIKFRLNPYLPRGVFDRVAGVDPADPRAGAGSGSRDPLRSAARNVWVIVTVADAETGQPVPDAWVRVESDAQVLCEDAQTGANGRFWFVGRVGDRYRVRLSRRGYEPVEAEFDAPSPAEGEDDYQHVIRLERKR